MLTKNQNKNQKKYARRRRKEEKMGQTERTEARVRESRSKKSRE
jgi:hypothetical protein